MDMVWTERLSVGNEVIDSEHRNLISLANDVIRAIKTRDSSGLVQAFEQLVHWLGLHFANEEKIARAIKFDFSKHKPAHQYSLKELQYLRDELIAKDGMWSDSAVDHFTRYLKNWMIDGHIVKLDMQMKPALQSHPYDFKPV